MNLQSSFLACAKQFCRMATVWGAFLYLSSAGLPLGALAHADDKPTKPTKNTTADADAKGKTLTGTVEAVDAAAGTITLRGKQGKDPKSAAAWTKVVSLAKDAKVLIDNGTGDKQGARDGALADVVAGAVATVRLSDDQKAVRIHVEGPAVRGTLKAIGADGRSLTAVIAKDKTESAEKVYPLAADAQVSVEGGDKSPKGAPQKIKLADLPLGVTITLKLSGDQKTVGSVHAEGRRVQGMLKEVDVPGKKVTLADKAGDKTFAVADDVRIFIADGKPFKGDKGVDKGTPPAEFKRPTLADLAVGSHVSLQLSLDQAKVVTIQAEGKVLRGTLKGVDASKNSITVAGNPKDGSAGEQTVELAKEAGVTIDEGQASRLAELPLGAQVTVKLSPDQKGAVAVHVEGPSVMGVIKGSPGSEGVTLDSKTVVGTYEIGKNASLVVDDRPGKMSELIEGSILHGKLSADKKRLIGAIRAEGPSVQGFVRAVNAADHSILVAVGAKGGVGGDEKNFATTKDVHIAVGKGGTAGKFSDLKADQQVVLRLAIDQKAASLVTIVEPKE